MSVAQSLPGSWRLWRRITHALAWHYRRSTPVSPGRLCATAHLIILCWSTRQPQTDHCLLCWLLEDDTEQTVIINKIINW